MVQASRAAERAGGCYLRAYFHHEKASCGTWAGRGFEPLRAGDLARGRLPFSAAQGGGSETQRPPAAWGAAVGALLGQYGAGRPSECGGQGGSAEVEREAQLDAPRGGDRTDVVMFRMGVRAV